MTAPNLAGLCGAVAIAFNIAPERVTAAMWPGANGLAIIVRVDGRAPSPDVQAFVDGFFDGARKLAAIDLASRSP